MIAAILLTLVSGTCGRTGDRCPPTAGGRIAGGAVAINIGNAITSADRAGNWWQLNTNGQMEAGSATTQVPQGSPGVSPLTFDGSTWYENGAGVAYPTGDFSFVVSWNPNAVSGSQTLGAKLVGTFVWMMQFTGTATTEFYVTNSVAATANATSAANNNPGTWMCAGGSYTSSTGAISLRQLGATTTASTGGTGVQAGSVVQSVAARGSGVNKLTGSSRGAFFTEKVLSVADIDRICAGVL